MFAQGYFSYDSKKSGGITVSHLRFGHNPIKSTYLINKPDFVACHNEAYVNQYDLLTGLKKNGTFLLNCTWSEDEVDKHLPAGIKRFIYENDIQFYTINATDLAEKIGLGNRINMIMQAAFFKLANVIELDKAIEYLKESIAQTYRKKGQAVVDMNCKAVDSGIGELNKVNVPESWKDAVDEGGEVKVLPEFVEKVAVPMLKQEGDSLPTQIGRASCRERV